MVIVTTPWKKKNSKQLLQDMKLHEEEAKDEKHAGQPIRKSPHKTGAY